MAIVASTEPRFSSFDGGRRRSTILKPPRAWLLTKLTVDPSKFCTTEEKLEENGGVEPRQYNRGGRSVGKKEASGGEGGGDWWPTRREEREKTKQPKHKPKGGDRDEPPRMLQQRQRNPKHTLAELGTKNAIKIAAKIMYAWYE